MAEDSVTTPSGIEYLKKEKGKLKWTGDLEQLQSFIKYALCLEGDWLSPGGDCKAFQNTDLTIRWYASSTNLILSGSESVNVQAKMLSLIELNTRLDDNIEQSSRSNEPIIDAESLNCKIGHFASEMQTNRLMIQKVAAELADKFSTIQSRPVSLKDEKETLFARINNLEYMLANLQNKVKAANDEKSCLITTIRLLREDIVAELK